MTSDLPAFWIGPPLALAGSVFATVGYRGRLREIRSPVPSTGGTTRGCSWAGSCVVAGALIPPYAYA